MNDEELFALGQRANLAIEGSLGDGAAKAIFDYVDAVLTARGDEMHASGTEGAALAFFLAQIRLATDPAGDSMFRLQVVRRNPNSKKTPAEVRLWERLNVGAALIVESLEHDDGWKKEAAIAAICKAAGVRRPAIFAAEKTALFKRMVKRRQDRRSSGTW